MKQFSLLLTILLLVQFSWSQNKKPGLQLRSGAIAEKENLQALTLTEKERGQRQFNRKNYVLLRFNQLPATSTKKELANAGVQLFDYIPGNAFFAEIPSTLDLTALKKFEVSGVFLPDASVKMEAALKTKTLLSEEAIAVHYMGSIDRQTVLQQLLQAGAQLKDHPFQPDNTVFVNADTAAISKIAALPFVTYLHAQMLKDQPLNYLSRSANNISSLADPSGRNLTGKGVMMGNGDEGDPTHLDFTGRLINHNPTNNSSHATHTLGTMMSAGILNPKHRGMAPRANAVVQYFSEILVNTPQWISEFGMVLTNNSYHSSTPGCDGTGEYDALSEFVDAQHINFPNLLHVFAAGNDGRKTCGLFPPTYGTVRSGFQSSKNCLIVGGYYNATDLIAERSSRGPVKDGRIKPEIVAGSESVLSTGVNNGYGIISGTSMAAPAVTGSIALLYERYRQLHGGANPTGALMKALVCNGADDMGNPGPDFLWGFGKLNIRTAVEMLEQQQYFTGSVTNGNNSTHTITGIPAGTVQLKVMLYWVDPPASPAAVTSLINNLDLTVKGTDPRVYKPLILNPNPAQVDADAVEGTDNLNNIEQVVIDDPSGDFTITVNGTNVPSGPQQYVVVYQLLQPVISVDYPAGGETMVPGEAEKIRWSAHDKSTNNFTIEYSADNGGNWTTIDNNVSADTRYYNWTAPVAAARQALIRVTRNSSVVSGTSANSFVVLGQPMITITNPCPAYASVSWAPVPDADHYELMQLSGDTMKVVGSTNANTFLLEGLNKDSTYWLSVRALINGKAGRRSVAATITPSGGTCSDAAFDNDLTVSAFTRPTNGMMNTSSQLTATETIELTIQNRGNISSSGSYQLSYRINNGSVITESSPVVITAKGSTTFAFAAQANLSAVGTYQIKAWVTYAADPLRKNDTAFIVVKQLDNQPVVLNPSFTEGFETAMPVSYTQKTVGFDGLDRATFNFTQPNGRARISQTDFARTGNRALVLDQTRYRPTANVDSVTLTFNLGAYSGTDQIWLDFQYRNQGIDFSLPNNKVWIRGNYNAAWVPVFTLPATPDEMGIFKPAPSINITETLSNAAQSLSSSFQVRFGQHAYTSSNTPSPQNLLDDGITFDDITLTRPSDDVGIRALINPVVQGACDLGNAVQLTVEVKNYGNSNLTNVEVGYNLNGAVVKEFISLNAGELKQHIFSTPVDFSNYQKYELRTWVHATGDSYVNNDSLPLFSFNTAPVINTFPYLQDFESNNGYWFTSGYSSSWQWGKPTKATINRSASGNNGWFTGLSTNYNDGEFSYLYSPCFMLNGMTQPVLSFSHFSITEEGCICDIHWVEYSTDDITWTKLGAFNSGTNWYNHSSGSWITHLPYWQVSSQELPVITGRIRFRFVMKSDPAFNMEGVGIDDVHIFDKALVYSGADIPAGITQPVSGSGWIHFSSGGNRIVSIDPQGQNLGNTTVKVFRNTSGTIRNNTQQYYLDRNIVINPASAPAGNVKVRFYFSDAEADSLTLANNCGSCTKPADPYRIGITQYSGAIAEENGQLSDNLSGLYQFIPSSQVKVIPFNNGYYAEFMVDHFSEFWINGGGPGMNQPLPVSLTQFTATRRNSTALLQWQTAQEINSKHFTIEKSTDGVLYIPIGVVAAAGNSQTPLHYQFTDQTISNGTNYYRLLVTDIDGKTDRSPVRTVQSADALFSLQVFPNPVTNGNLYIRSSVAIKSIQLADLSGRVLLQQNTSGMQHQLSLKGYAKGTYLLSITTHDRKEIQRIVIGE